jgi:OHCU decarboxylase
MHMSAASSREQREAGLAGVTLQQATEFQRLNESYRRRFGFPFLLAIKGRSVQHVLASLEARLNAAEDQEFAEALRQVARIACFRLTDAIDRDGSLDASETE